MKEEAGFIIRGGFLVICEPKEKYSNEKNKKYHT